ncbi:MAG: NAD(P)/FAD-dependent oxidoreductase [Amylibacter sp.]|nr:NAD(P)/FAD-dependent oxidoreductase [Amylibacter sp.]
MRSCDVLIIGGGPAGLSVASSLSPDILSIIVHQDSEIGKPVRTSGGSFLSDMRALSIPEKYYQLIDRLDFYSDKSEALFNIETDKMVVLDITGLYQYLASLSDDKSRELLLSTKFITTEQQADGSFISTIRGRKSGEETIQSKYIIDATGWQCAVLGALGHGRKPDRTGIGTEYEFEQSDYPMNRAILFVGSHVLSGYGWVFPTNYNRIRLGVGVIKPDTDESPRDVMNALLASGFLDKLGVKVPDDFETNSGIIPSVAFEEKVIFGNMIRVGDSANCATPIAGEGIRIAIEQGRLLGEALSKTIAQKSPSYLQAYEKSYGAKYARDYKIGFWANQRITGYKPADWDKSVRRINSLSEAQMIQLLRSRFNLKSLLRTGFLHLKRKLFG